MAAVSFRLQRMGVLTEADGLALANLCQTCSTLISAQEKLNESWILYQTPRGYVMQNPLLSIVNRCFHASIPVEATLPAACWLPIV